MCRTQTRHSTQGRSAAADRRPRPGSIASRTDDSPDFELPDANVATVPPESRGLARDEIRLLVTTTDGRHRQHRRFSALPDLLEPDDLLVVNRSATIPAALPARRADGREAVVHLAHRLGPDLWAVELREPRGRGTGPSFDAIPGEPIDLPNGASMSLLAPYRRPDTASPRDRLWLTNWNIDVPPLAYLRRHGGPIRYDYIDERVPLDAYQTIVGSEPGSAEMPSAARGLSHQLLDRLRARGIDLASIVLHTGVSSFEGDESPYPERFRVPAETVEALQSTKHGDGRVIAVGTTVVRALESALVDGDLRATGGWTDRIIRPDDDLRAVDGLLTGLHPPESSHLAMLRALSPVKQLFDAYRDAVSRGYLWHEFGDAHLIV